VNSEISIADRLAGKFLVFDGPDGCGKSTQIERLSAYLKSAGVRVVHGHDPGGTKIGDRIRTVLLGYDLSSMNVRCETLLFMASRAQLVAEVIKPALADGAVVLCSRFISATYAYQGAAGYDTDDLQQLGDAAIGDAWPDMTIVLDVPVEKGFERTGRKPHHAGGKRVAKAGGQGELFVGATVDAMEARPIDFHRRVREIFLTLPKLYPAPVHVVEGSGDPDAVHARVLETLRCVDP
jgi:dTMP kinase